MRINSVLFLSCLIAFTCSSNLKSIDTAAAVDNTAFNQLLTSYLTAQGSITGLYTTRFQWITIKSDGQMTSDAIAFGANEKVLYEKTNSGHYTFKHVATNKFLSIKNGVAKFNESSPTENCNFKIEAGKLDKSFLMSVKGTYFCSEGPDFTVSSSNDDCAIMRFATVASQPPKTDYEQRNIGLFNFYFGGWIIYRKGSIIFSTEYSSEYSIEAIRTDDDFYLIKSGKKYLGIKNNQLNWDIESINSSCKWKLIIVDPKEFTFKLKIDNYYLSSNEQFITKIDDDRAIWGLNRKAPEFKYPELENSKTGIYSYINQQWVSCQPNGSLEINRNWWQQWEYMEIRRTPDGFYTIRSTNFNRYLGIENNKASFNFKDINYNTKWKIYVVKGDYGVLLIKFGIDGVYLSSNSNNNTYTTTFKDDDYIIFSLSSERPKYKTDSYTKDKTGLYAVSDEKWASCQPNGNLEVNRNWWREWEFMRFFRLTDGTYIVKSTNFDRFLGIQNGKASFGFRNIEAATKFTLTPFQGTDFFRLSIGSYYLSSVANRNFVSSTDDESTIWAASGDKVGFPGGEYDNQSTGLYSYDVELWASAQPNGNLEVNRSWWQQWEKFAIKRALNGSYTIRSTFLDKYLCIINGKADVRSSSLEAGCYFDILKIKGTSYLTFYSVGYYLSSNSPNFVSTFNDDDSILWAITSERPSYQLTGIESNKTGIFSLNTQFWASCQGNGNLEINRSWWREWEYIRVRRTLSGLYTFYSTNFSRFLTYSNGKYSFANKTPGPENKFKVDSYTSSDYDYIRISYNNVYLSSNGNNYASTMPDDSTKFALTTEVIRPFFYEATRTGIYCNDNSKWVSCQPNGSLEINRNWWREWEYIEVTKNSNSNSYTFRSTYFNRYLTVDGNNASFSSRDANNQNNRWEVIKINRTEFYLRNVSTGKYLTHTGNFLGNSGSSFSLRSN